MQFRNVNAFTKFIQFCHKNHFVNVKVAEKPAFNTLQYGPFGTLLKQNIFKEWICFFLNNSDVTMFPMEISSSDGQSSHIQTLDQLSDSLLPDAMDTYFQTISSFGHHSTFGLAAYGPSINRNISRQSSLFCSDIDILSNLKACTCISMIFFCPTKMSMKWFYYWSKQRYLWWRKYSSIPSKFSMSDIVTTPSGDQKLSLLLDFPWGKSQLETITLHNQKSVEESCQKHSSNTDFSFNQENIPAVVVCESELDSAVLAYLANSYAEKCRDRKTKKVFHLHYKLAPYKVCLSLEETNTESLNKLKNVSGYLIKELKEAGINTFPTFELNFPISDENDFESYERFDEMGIPYMIVLNENSLQTGIAGLRNRDTTLKEQIHITELTAKLIKYLKIK